MDVLKKKCSKCKLELNVLNFNKCLSRKDGLQSYCKECKRRSNKDLRDNNKEAHNKRQRAYRDRNKEYLYLNRREYVKNNKETILAKQREYEYKRYQEDSQYRLMKNIRSRTNSAFKAKGIKKNTKTKDMLGCTERELITHIESQFKKGMNWENKREWHIDHIIPLSSAKDEKELVELSNYKNLQPLWEIENKIKSNKLL